VDEKPPRAGGRVLLVVLFVVYLFLLAWIVLWKLEIPFVGGGGLRQIKLVPFAATAGAGASAPFEIVANFVLFVPFGIYLGLLAPLWPWQKAACVVAGASLILEVPSTSWPWGVRTSPTSSSTPREVWSGSACSTWPAAGSRRGPP
jgi:glycopeptide antibiotics resistance protein